MKLRTYLFIILLFYPILSIAQNNKSAFPNNTIDFISDTQQPMWVEKIVLKSTHNIKATALLFEDIIKTKPESLYMLGDIVSLGYSNHKWKKVDKFLSSCRNENTLVCGLLGNHDVMGRRKKGERNFDKRFPQNIRTGYMSVTDSVAIILLNSNFKTLSSTDKQIQDNWYQQILNTLDSNEAIKAVIVTCHHAPFSNSKIVGSSGPVQQNFVMPYINSKKGQLFITGHSHNFEHFNLLGKDFLVIGGGGGLHQPINTSNKNLPDLAAAYKPLFHYLSVNRVENVLKVTSHYLDENFADFESGHTFTTNILHPAYKDNLTLLSEIKQINNN